MSKMTNYMENALADMVRGQGLTLPADWYLALGSAADDTGFTEVTGTSYGRVAVTRSLANFSGTQGAGTTTASTGTSHATRNNTVITWPTAGAGGWTAATKVGLYDSSSGGNCWMYTDIASVTVAAGTAHSQAISTLVWTLGLTGGMTDYLANKLIDLIWRAQAFSWPATCYVRLVSTTPTNAAGGVELSGSGYARQSIASSLTAWSGTQGAGTTVASSGTAGRISNNADLTWGAPAANWGTATYSELMDAISGGNRLFWSPLGSPKTISNGGLPPKFLANAYGITFA